MKKSYFSNLGLFLLAFLCGAQMFGQVVVNMPATNVNAGTFTPAGGGVCYIRFNDQGGEGAAYGQPMGVGTQVTFAPSNPANKIRVSFITPTQWTPPAPAGNNTQNNGFAETTFDALYVYDGPNVAAPVISGGATATAGPGLGATGWNNSTGFPQNYGVPVVAGLPTFDRSVRATAANASGALTFRFVADFSVNEPGWTAMVWEEFPGNGVNTVAPFVVPAAGACAMTAPANITVPAAAGTCAANVTTASPIFTPAGCNSTANLFYSVDGGTPVLIGNVVPATITLTNIPVGVHTITYSLVNLCGGASAAPVTQTVTVLDTQAPVITCPGNMIINLAPGECSAQVSYTVGITDNCPLVVPVLLTQNPIAAGSCTYNPAQAISAALSLNCGGAQTKFGRVFPAQSSALPITGIQIGQRVAGGGNYTVAVYRLTSGTAPAAGNANMVLLGTQVFAMAQPGAYPQYVPRTFTTPIVVPAGSPFFVEIISPTGNFTMGNINFADCSATPSYIAAAACGLPNYGTFASVGFTTLSLAFNIQGLIAAPPPNQIAGLPSGAEFPIGVTTNCYQGVDVAGNTATCCFTVTVNEYPNAITSLICNDHVQFSLDEDCVDDIKADQILEGGPYGCYDNYIVELDKTPNGVPCNGAWVPAVLNANDVGKCYCVRVTDPATGNSCWGNVCIEDKLDPTITCSSQDLECNELPINEPSPALVGPQEYIKVVDDEIDTNASTPDQITYTFNVPIPAGIPVLDLDVRLDMTFGWWGELNMNLTSPDGFASSPLELGGCNGQAFTFDAQFDDEGTAGFTLCVQFDVDGAHIQSLQLPGVQSPNIFSPFDGHAAGGTWTWQIMDTFSDNDPVTGGYIRMVGLIITVNAPAILPADNCDANPTTTYMDSFVDNGCAGVVQTRMWTVTDDSGNSATCNQTITYNPTSLADIVFPPNYDDLDAQSFDCGLFQGPNGGFVGYPSPEWIESQGLQGRPYMNGIDAQGYCDINWTYDDVIIDICDGSFKIRRQWIIIDWCTGEDIEVNQIIKVLDTTGPSIAVDVDPNTPGIDAPNLVNNIPTVILGTDYYACCSKEDAPSLIVGDDCSDVVSAKVDIRVGSATGAKLGTVNGSLTLLSTWPLTWQVTFAQGLLCIPIGTYIYVYSVTDDCGNVSTFNQRVIIRDWTPPTAICHEYTTVAVGADDSWDCYPANGVKTLAEQGGVVWVPATAFDNGSDDNCGNFALTVRRMAPYTDCINNLNPQDSDPFCDPTDLSFDFVSEYQIAIQENDSIKFYCCEVGTSQIVILRVYQLDDNGNFVFGPDNQPIYNECMVEIEVQDKIKPFCQAPANKTVTCEEFDPLIWYGNLTYGDNCCVEDVDTSYTYIPNQITFEQCNYGQVRRIFTVEDCNGNSSRCTQTITVNYKEQYRVYFPDDQNITQCNGNNMLVQPVIFGENCELIGVSHEDQIFDVVPDACYKILRTWKVLNWCTYNPNQGEVVIPNPTTSTQGARIWIGGNAAGTAPAWANYNAQSPEVSTVPALMINYPTSLVNPGTPAYVYTQVIKVQDQTPPTQAAIDPSLSTPNYDFCDYSTNDPLQWNEDASYNPWGIDNTWSPQCQSHDLCEGIVDLSIIGQDDCTGDNVNFRYLLFLDLNGDGVMETTINSEIPTLGFGIKEDELSGGGRIGRVTRDFETDDLAPTFDHTKYPNFALPYGSHKIKWIVEDRCGNDFSKEYPIIVRDCKNPTVVCINGLAINQMNTPSTVMAPSVCLWATDFLLYAEDNCSQPWQIDIAIRDADINPGSGFPIDPNTGGPQAELCWDCSQLGTNTVELWAKDKANNADFCLTYLILSDNTGACGPNPSMANVAGALKTNAQFTAPTQNPGGVANAEVKMVGQGANGVPDPAVFGTNDLGTFNFAGLPVLSDWNVVPTKDNNPLNGVSTFDLVAMSKHILGVKPFTTGYQYLAADINNNKQVTTFDIVELRKLILGVYTDFPANTSWRFVDKNFNFSMATNPLQQNFKEFVQVGDIPAGSTNGVDFVGVKVGDLNSDVIANNMVTVDDRNPVATQLFDVKDRDVKAGEEVTVEFTAAELAKAAGFQFTMNYNGLEFVEILNGANITTENFAVFAQDKAITASWNGDATEATFSVKFRATTDGKLSTMLGVSSRITAAEAYTKDAQQMDVAFRFNGENGSTIAGVGFELYQNMPNPFVEKTFIGFNLPAATDATLNVFDAQGKLLVSQSGKFNKGYNSIAVDRASLKGAGLVYYTIETATDSATRKMIMMD